LTAGKRDRRRYPKLPLVGVGAVVLDRDRVLLALRDKQPMEGWWSLPGGLVEAGESLVDAVRREMREETGLEVRPLAVVEVFERIQRDAKGRVEYHYVLIDFLCRVASGKPTAASDARAVQWARRRDIPKLRITEGTLPVIKKAFRIRRGFR
jgi:ADP-ribose pyrophosphatase YjhB (NUDIX family)